MIFVPVRFRSRAPRRNGLCSVPIFVCTKISHMRRRSSSFVKSHACCGDALVNAGMTPPPCYHLFTSTYLRSAYHFWKVEPRRNEVRFAPSFPCETEFCGDRIRKVQYHFFCSCSTSKWMVFHLKSPSERRAFLILIVVPTFFAKSQSHAQIAYLVASTGMTVSWRCQAFRDMCLCATHNFGFGKQKLT